MHARVAALLQGIRLLLSSLCICLVLATVSDAASISGRVTGFEGVFRKLTWHFSSDFLNIGRTTRHQYRRGYDASSTRMASPFAPAPRLAETAALLLLRYISRV